MHRLRLPALVLASTLALSGCSYGYGDYGYGGVSVGYGGGHCDPWWDDCYYGNSWYGDPWYGWYDDYYYPGWGVFVYDQWRRPHRWNDHHRRFWESRRHRWADRDWNDRRWERWDRWDRREWRRDRRRDRDWRRWRGSDARGAAPSGMGSNSAPRDSAEVWTRERSRDWSGRRSQEGLSGRHSGRAVSDRMPERDPE